MMFGVLNLIPRSFKSTIFDRFNHEQDEIVDIPRRLDSQVSDALEQELKCAPVVTISPQVYPNVEMARMTGVATHERDFAEA